jgi:hypothetical protein
MMCCQQVMVVTERHDVLPTGHGGDRAAIKKTGAILQGLQVSTEVQYIAQGTSGLALTDSTLYI